jgi:hypothetical protein
VRQSLDVLALLDIENFVFSVLVTVVVMVVVIFVVMIYLVLSFLEGVRMVL